MAKWQNLLRRFSTKPVSCKFCKLATCVGTLLLLSLDLTAAPEAPAEEIDAGTFLPFPICSLTSHLCFHPAFLFFLFPKAGRARWNAFQILWTCLTSSSGDLPTEHICKGERHSEQSWEVIRRNPCVSRPKPQQLEATDCCVCRPVANCAESRRLSKLSPKPLWSGMKRCSPPPKFLCSCVAKMPCSNNCVDFLSRIGRAAVFMPAFISLCLLLGSLAAPHTGCSLLCSQLKAC